MALFFNCPCGQCLRIEEDQAGGSTRCPACCRFVLAPSLEGANQVVGLDTPAEAMPLPVQMIPAMPDFELKAVEISSTHFDPPPRQPAIAANGNTSPAYQLSSVKSDGLGEDYDAKAARKRIRQAVAEAEKDFQEERRKAQAWRLEMHWHECILYPVRALAFLLVLAAAWATLIALVWAILPRQWNAVEIGIRWPLLLIAFLLLGYTFACFKETLTAARMGQAGYIAWPPRDLGRMALGGSEAVFCFLAGPIVPAFAGVLFWLESGDLKFVDWLIVWELGIVAVCYWALAFLAVQQNGRWRDANPVFVVKLVRDHGMPALIGVLVIATAVVGHCFLMLTGLETLHDGLGGWVLLVGAWAALLAAVLFAMRWVGISKYRGRQRKPSESAAPYLANLSSSPSATIS